MGGDCDTFDFACKAGEALDNILVFYANTMSSLSWMMIRAAFTGNAGTIQDNEWSVATAMTSRWGLVLLVVVVALVLVQMIMSVASGNIRQAISAFVAGLLSWPTTLVAVWLTVVLTGATDRLTIGVLGSGDEPAGALIATFLGGIDDLPMGDLEKTGSKAILIAGMVTISAIASLMLSLMLAFRNFALICLVGFSPIAFMALPLSSIRVWAAKWTQAVAALILAKPIAAGMLVLAVDLTAASDDIFQWLVGIVAMAMAAFAPVITLRLFSFMGAETAASYGGQGQAVMTNTTSGAARGGRAIASAVR
ncbi:MAG: hypothetical protein L0J57_00145 [Brachybacterium sp.]|nr:hypothetical protein [Kocuria sp.]MDN6301448.1 hypothetical protein [Brachybacterium sp.]